MVSVSDGDERRVGGRYASGLVAEPVDVGVCRDCPAASFVVDPPSGRWILVWGPQEHSQRVRGQVDADDLWCRDVGGDDISGHGTQGEIDELGAGGGSGTSDQGLGCAGLRGRGRGDGAGSAVAQLCRPEPAEEGDDPGCEDSETGEGAGDG